MTDNTELKRLAEAISQKDIADPIESKRVMLVEPAAVLALIAENERLFKLLERTVEQYVPLTELEGVPGWSRVVELVEVVAQRDQLRAEVAGLRTGYEAYERVNAELKAENEALRNAFRPLLAHWDDLKAGESLNVDAARRALLIKQAQELEQRT